MEHLLKLDNALAVLEDTVLEWLMLLEIHVVTVIELVRKILLWVLDMIVERVVGLLNSTFSVVFGQSRHRHSTTLLELGQFSRYFLLFIIRSDCLLWNSLHLSLLQGRHELSIPIIDSRVLILSYLLVYHRQHCTLCGSPVFAFLRIFFAVFPFWMKLILCLDSTLFESFKIFNCLYLGSFVLWWLNRIVSIFWLNCFLCF